ncbi:ATP-grasp domain-containing protein [Candidatus Gracilibacteria bacterium]|nr:ATP-grasp domain-containing protein [Candidatus Gracilibacteria bacterium]
MSKNILIVTGSNYTNRVYEAFYETKKLGHKLYLLSDGSFEPTAGIFEKHFTYDLRKTKEVLEYMNSQPIHFDAVTIKTSEWLTPLTALLAKEYGCIGNAPIVAFNCRSKYHMRQELKKGGVPIPQFRLCKNYKGLLNAVQEIGVPCVAKPVGGNASYGTFMIQTEKDLIDLEKKYNFSIEYLKKKAIDEDVFAFTDEEMDLMGVREHVDMITDYLVEEFMAGPEVSVDALVQNGKVTITGIEDQIRMEPPYFLQTASRLPYVCDEKQMSIIQKIVEQTVHSIEIQNSATHTEIIFTPQGPKIVEIGCRIGGDDLHDTIWEVTGCNLMFESIMIALGISRDYDIKTLCHTTTQVLIPTKSGTITEINIPESVKTNPSIFCIDLLLKPGDKTGPPPQSFDYIGYISARGISPEDAKKNLEDALKKISINIV